MNNQEKQKQGSEEKIDIEEETIEERERIEEKIDEELDQSFPASDPPSYSQPGNDDIKHYD